MISQFTPAQAQINNGRVLLAQVVDGLPPAPPMQEIPSSQQPIILEPQVQPVQPASLNQYNQDVTPYPSVRSNQFNPNRREIYLVFVDNLNYEQLQRIRAIEPRAYVRQYNGRSVIQSGSFSREANAQQRVRELQLSGINGVQVVRSSTGQPIASFSNNPDNIQKDRRRESASAYYVIIPAKSEELNLIANRIRQSTGRYDRGIVERQNPRGAHVAIGPFNKRTDAEQWNNYVRNLGFGNARVYYGR